MNTLVLYATKYGATAKAAQLLAQKLPGDVTLVDLGKSTAPDLDAFDNVVIGSAVYVGKILDPVKNYLETHAESLRAKNIGLFICCANEEHADEQLKANFAEPLLSITKATGHFGYAIQLQKMNFFERTAIKMIMKTRESSENIMENNIQQFAKALTS